MRPTALGRREGLRQAVFPVFQYRYGKAMAQLQALVMRGSGGQALRGQP
jgi:hypothetical protein